MASHDMSSLPVAVGTAAVLGLLVGSFLNVVVYRVPLGLSVNRPRSFCPGCRHQLSWSENVPVVSWLALRGRCRHCATPVSVRYPAVELATGATFAWATWTVGGGWRAAAYCCLGATLLALVLIESSGRAAPLRVAMVGTVTSLALLVPATFVSGDVGVLLRPLAAFALALSVLVVSRRLGRAHVDRPDGSGSILVAACWLGTLGLRAVVVAVLGAAVFGVGCAFAPRLLVRLHAAVPAQGPSPALDRVLTSTWMDLTVGAALVIGLAVQSWP